MADKGNEGAAKFLSETPAVTDVARGIAHALILAAQREAGNLALEEEILESPLKDGPPVGGTIGL